MSELAFVISPRQNAFFRELAELLCDEINDAGGTASISLDGFPESKPGRAFVLLPPHEYRAVEEDEKEENGPVLKSGAWPDRETLARTIFITAEQPGGQHFPLNVALATDAGALFDFNRLAVREYRRIGLPVEHLPLGYSPRWDRFEQQDDRDVDVLFLGCATPRRLGALAGYAGDLTACQAELLVSDNSHPNVVGSPGFVSGDEKLALLSRSRVLLNLHRDEQPYFEWVRVLEAIHCGTAVVSERSVDVDPLRPGVHYLEGETHDLGRLARELARDEERRAQLARTAYETLREKMPLRASAERLARTAESLETKPVPRRLRPKAWLLASRASDAAARAIRQSAARAYRAATASDDDGPVLHAAIKDLRLDLMELERKARSLEQDLSPDAEIEEVCTSAGYGSAPPRITVICALYNHAGHIAAALDSVAAQRFNDWELVVCDDGSTDQSGSVAESWIEEHPKSAAALIRHSVNRGLPAARNSAVERARGEYVLVLDADNELYPHCMERLVGALEDDPEAAFAYGILEQFDRSGPVGLSGYFTWEPERLAEENYIDALALISRQRLEELGGYSTDRRLYGWEDYDLWCRIAERGGHAAHVPEIVARYRLAPGSMISLTNLSVRDAREAIAERSPGVFALGERSLMQPFK